MKERALKKTCGRIFMVRLLGNDASDMSCLIQAGLKIARVTHRRKLLRDRYVIQWDKRRPMPSYAQNFCAALAEYMREVLPITQPSSSVAARRKR